MASLRDRRLRQDFETLTSYGHPHIEIHPIRPSGEMPPGRYNSIYFCRGVTDRQFTIKTRHVVRMELRADYPKAGPVFSTGSKLWHPNIFEGGLIDTGYEWRPMTRLLDVFSKIGEMIEYSRYNLDSLANHGISNQKWSEWLESHRNSIPLGMTDFNYHRNNKPSDIGFLAVQLSNTLTGEEFDASIPDDRKIVDLIPVLTQKMGAGNPR